MRTWCYIFIRSVRGICCTPPDRTMFQFQMSWHMKQILSYRKSHILTVPSLLPDTNHFPSLLKAIEVTLLECPSKVVSWNHWALPDKMEPMRIHTISERELECDECRPYSTKSRGGIVTCSKMEGAHSFKLSVKSVFNNSSTPGTGLFCGVQNWCRMYCKTIKICTWQNN